MWSAVTVIYQNTAPTYVSDPSGALFCDVNSSSRHGDVVECLHVKGYVSQLRISLILTSRLHWPVTTAQNMTKKNRRVRWERECRRTLQWEGGGWAGGGGGVDNEWVKAAEAKFMPTLPNQRAPSAYFSPAKVTSRTNCTLPLILSQLARRK